MAEVLGLVASVIQVAGAGLKLSQTLYQYADGVATADRRIKDIAKEVQLTSLVIDELGNVFRRDETVRLISKTAVTTAEETMKECSAVFAEIETTLAKSKKGRMGKWTLPFRDNKIELLRSHIEKLKSTLQLLMQVLLHAFQVTSNQLDRAAEARQREELRELLELQKQATKRYEDSLRDFSISDGSTMVDDDDRSEDKDTDDLSATNVGLVTVSAIESTITPDTLAVCMQHAQSLLQDIQSLKQVLEQNGQGADHSNHHQTLLGSYLQTRAHLDKILLGTSPSNRKISSVIKSSPLTSPSQTRITTSQTQTQITTSPAPALKFSNISASRRRIPPRTTPLQPHAPPSLLTSAHPRFPETPGPGISLEESSELHGGMQGHRSYQEYDVRCFDSGGLVPDEQVGVPCGAVFGGGEEVVVVEGEEEVDELVKLWTNIGRGGGVGV
ncbi:hypothetical protein IAQ61_000414 [Plenodomus lingam]|uniref:Predicted protein n=1 Tax=Leptosphaeria maculans (strain JN3 / isolate v23.1.3 / race Av1-4-5-6-7-8) TaxID=985895 RepID=E5R4W2_LEPMJ|nr:predicted protein [Plenodomus lingam JN3]KAH9881687.1 hypothetical protein IAQ61_000414 [Plenodomus lingam]CBX92235.1 predicted protein [Plenodomus lingam JN3]